MRTTERGVKRRTPALRVSSLLLLLVLVAVQPQALCGLHCMFFAGFAPMGAPAGHPAHGDHATLCHGSSITGGRTIPTGRLATAWLPAAAAPTLPPPLHAFAIPVPPPARPSVLPEPESPPPRG